MKIVGTILIVLGVIGLLVFGIQAINKSETLQVFGLELAASSANWTPVIISGLVTMAGIIFAAMGRKSVQKST